MSDEDFAIIRAQVRDFVRTRVVPRETEIMTEDRVPDDLRTAAAEMGLFGYAIPAEWGGLGLDLTQDVELAMELGYTTLSLRSMFGTNNGIAGQVLVGFGMELHQCVGQHVARLEAAALLTALARRVERLEPAGEPTRHLNNTLRAFASQPLRLHRAR